MNKPTPYQQKILSRIRNGERLSANLTLAYSKRNMVIGLGVHRFADGTPVKLDTIMSLRSKDLAYTRRVIEDSKYGQTGYEEIFLP